MKLAMWLLARFGVLERNESLAGDLLEERAAGRSRVWLWRQVVSAIVESVLRDWKEHWALALRAIATGWLLNAAWGQVVMAVDRYEIGRVHTGPWHPEKFCILFTFSVWPVMIGWIVARTHRRSLAMVLAFALLEAGWTIWYLGTNYTVLQRAPVAGQWTYELKINLWFVVATLAGGLLDRRGPAPSAEWERNPL